MNTLIEMQKERETKLKSARLEAGFFNISSGLGVEFGKVSKHTATSR